MSLADLDRAPLPELKETEIDPFCAQRLWRAVILRAFADAAWVPTRGEKMDPEVYMTHHNNRSYALTWLRGNTDQFRYVCELAGYHPHTVREAARRQPWARRIDKTPAPITVTTARQRLKRLNS